MTLDTKNTIYIGLDGTNAEVKILVPRNLPATINDVVELRLDDRNPESTDAAEYKLAETEMTEHRFEL